MKMKKIYIYAMMSAASIFGLGSCSSFLEQSSPSVFTPDVTYGDVDMTYKVLMGVYSKFNEDATYSQYLGIILNCQSDSEIRSFTAGAPASDDGRGVTNYMPATDGSSSMVSKTVEALYAAIERANGLIEGIEGASLYGSKHSDIVTMHGEAIALRAQCYRDLIRLLGDVPFKMEATKPDLSNVYLPKTDRFAIMETLIGQLLQYADELPWRQDTPERISQGYARGLCAQLALMRAGWNFSTDGEWVEPRADAKDWYKIAMEQTKIVMDEGGYYLTEATAQYSGFENLWRTICSRQYVTNEVLYEIGFILSRSSEFGYTIGPRLRTTTTAYGYATQGQILTTIDMFYSYHPDDTRRPISVYATEFRDISDTGDYTNGVTSKTGISEYMISNPSEFRVGKWNTMWMPSDFASASYAANTKVGTGVNYPMMRYSDILLMFAEASYMYNEAVTDEARNALYTVRHRAIPTMNEADFAAYLSTKDFLKAVKDERRWELLGEGSRKWDLVRWGDLETAMKTMKNNCLALVGLTGTGITAYQFEFKTRRVNGETVDRVVPKNVYYKYDDNNEMMLDVNYDYERTKLPGAEYFQSATGGLWFWDDQGEQRGVVKDDVSKKKYQCFVQDVASGLERTDYGAYYCPFYPVPSSMIRDYNGLLKQDYGFPN